MLMISDEPGLYRRRLANCFHVNRSHRLVSAVLLDPRRYGYCRFCCRDRNEQCGSAKTIRRSSFPEMIRRRFHQFFTRSDRLTAGNVTTLSVTKFSNPGKYAPPPEMNSSVVSTSSDRAEAPSTAPITFSALFLTTDLFCVCRWVMIGSALLTV